MEEKEITLRDGKKPRDIKEHNTNLVLSLFRSMEEPTISSFSEKTALSKTTISRILNRLAQRGIIIPSGHGRTTEDGGKPPVIFSLYPEYCYSIIISAGYAHHISCVVVNFMGDTICHDRIDTAEDLSYPEAVQIIVRLIRAAVERCGISEEKLCGIAILFDGIIDSLHGVIINSIYRPWGNQLPICEDVSRALPFRTTVIVNNTSRFSSFAELAFLHGSSNRSAIVIVWETDKAMDCHLLINQRLVDNSEGLAGGFSHFILDPTSTVRCQCGRCGCLQSLLSNESLLEYVSRAYSPYLDSPVTKKFLAGELTVPYVFLCAKEGDQFALKLLDKVANYFSLLIHNILCLCTVDEVILQGIFSLSGDVFLQKITLQIQGFNNLPLNKNVEISYSKYFPVDGTRKINPYYRGANMFLSHRFIDRIP